VARPPLKEPPAYVLTSADHALRVAVMLQLEGGLTVSEVAARLGVARSTAHRVLQTLVYRDFAVQDERRVYHPGPVLELAAHSQSTTSRQRTVALPHLHRLVETLDESVNLTIRTGDLTRFVASVEAARTLRVSSREGMVFPAVQTTGGLLLLAELPAPDLRALYSEERFTERAHERPDLPRLRTELARIRRQGFAVNHERSEHGVVAVGVPLRDGEGTAVAALSVSMPSVRYDKQGLPRLVAVLQRAAARISADLAQL